uniref:Uncharacterized protein n=1 Tax=Arundo donax TaxID=35708 RepID=A0A0A9CJ78_ARUDO
MSGCLCSSTISYVRLCKLFSSSDRQEKMGSWNISSSSEPFSIIHISERVHGAFFRMRRISSILINCCRIVSACRTMASSNCTFLLSVAIFDPNLGRFKDDVLCGSGVEPSVNPGILLPTKIDASKSSSSGTKSLVLLPRGRLDNFSVVSLSRAGKLSSRCLFLLVRLPILLLPSDSVIPFSAVICPKSFASLNSASGADSIFSGSANSEVDCSFGLSLDATSC